jgi:hypothetical protein
MTYNSLSVALRTRYILLLSDYRGKDRYHKEDLYSIPEFAEAEITYSWDKCGERSSSVDLLSYLL